MNNSDQNGKATNMFWDRLTESFHAWEIEDEKGRQGSDYEKTVLLLVRIEYENNLLSHQCYLLY